MAFTEKQKKWIDHLTLIYARCEASLEVTDDLRFLVKIKRKHPYIHMLPVRESFTAESLFKNNGIIFKLSDDKELAEQHIKRSLGINKTFRENEENRDEIQKAVNDVKRILKNLNEITLGFLEEHPFENTFWIPSLLSREIEKEWGIYKESYEKSLYRYYSDEIGCPPTIEEIFVKKHMTEEFINFMDSLPKSRKATYYKNILVIYEKFCNLENTPTKLLDLLYNWFDGMIAPSYGILDNGDFIQDFVEDIKDGVI